MFSRLSRGGFSVEHRSLGLGQTSWTAGSARMTATSRPVSSRSFESPFLNARNASGTVTHMGALFVTCIACRKKVTATEMDGNPAARISGQGRSCQEVWPLSRSRADER